VALPHRTRSHMSGQSGSIAPTPLAQGHTSTRAALAAIWGSRSLSPESPPAYEDASSTAVVSLPADMIASSTPIGSPTSDIERASARKWGLSHIRHKYVSTVFKPGGRLRRGILSKRTSESGSNIVYENSQLPEAKLKTTKECVSCMEDFSAKEMVHLTCHGYCSPCFTLLIE
jgi:hypothetical protein